MARKAIQYNNVGTVLRVRVRENGNIKDLSSATAKSILLKKPDGTKVEKTAAWTTDGSDGMLEYETVSNDLDALGTWKIQGKVTISSKTRRTRTGTFEVLANAD